MVALTSPPEESDSPSLRIVFALGALLLFRWSVYGPVSTATTAEIEARDKLRVLIDLSQAALRAQHYGRALQPLMELTRIQPKNHVYWWQRAIVLRELRRPQDELFALEEFVKIAPLPTEACPRIPFIYQELGQKKEALEAFERCFGYNRNDSQDAFYFGYALERDGQVDRALQVYTEALTHGTNGDDEAGQGRMLLRKGDPVAATKAVTSTLTRNPNHVDALLVAGIALSRQGKPAEAKVLLERGAARKDSSDFQYALGTIAEMEGKPGDALAHYEASLRLDPNNQDATNRRALLARKGK